MLAKTHTHEFLCLIESTSVCAAAAEAGILCACRIGMKSLA